MLVEEALSLVRCTPTCHDSTAARYNTREALHGKGDVLPAKPCVDGKVVHSLLGLLYKCVSVDLPRELGGVAFYLLKSLVEGNGAHGYG